MFTDNKIKGLKPTEKRYSLSAGEGLSIDVMPTGRKSWVLEYTALGKRKRKKLGEYPAVSLKQARELANKIKDNAGLTPITVSELIHEWIELYSKQWTSEEHDNPTDNPILDKCGGRMKSCVCRFGRNKPLPFGGCPASSLIGS